MERTEVVIQPDDGSGRGSPMDAPWSVRRLRRLVDALDATSYLEIGVLRGGTFRRIAAPQRIGVDPRFVFDTSRLSREPGVRLVETTSDAFFSRTPSATTFDVVYIDGLHTFAQSYRDLCHILAHAHRRTVILMDDTMPIDVFSAMPDEAQALRRRAASGSDKRHWHGEVFRTVFAVHDFHMALDYRTIIGSGNGQTLLWFSKSGPRVPLLDSFEAIDRLSYFEAMDHLEAFRITDEESAFAACFDALGVPADHRGQAG